MATSGKFHSRPKVKPKADLGDHLIPECPHKLNGKHIHYKPAKATEGKEMVQFYRMGVEEELIIPSRKPIEYPGIWANSEFERLKRQAHVVTDKERITMMEEAEQKKVDQLAACEARKQALQKAQVKQGRGPKLTGTELEAKRKNEYLLQRSYELLNEQDDRVKNANGLILATKCRAIRNAQIAEKELIKKQLEEEDRRLDGMMEQQRQKSINSEEKKREVEEEKKQRYIVEIKQQIKENEIEKMLDAERIEEESRMINKALIELQKQEERKQLEVKELQHKIREDLHQANIDLERYKILQREEQRIADMRVQEFMRKKAEREAIREAELAQIKAAKEREIQRLRAAQEKAQDRQAMMEMNAARIQEEVEKAWREKEKAAAIKKIADLEELRMARAKQIEDIRRAQAIKIQRDEEDFHKVAKVQQQQYDKEMEKKSYGKCERMRHRKDLLKQINEKERERINMQKEKFDDGKAYRLKQEIRDREIQDYLKQKMTVLRNNQLPEACVKDIERQLKLQN